MLGENRGHIPRHAKVYRNFAAQRDRMQEDRILAYQKYISDVKSQSYPSTDCDISIETAEFDQFISPLN